jgi:hypothetical protein
MGIGMAGEPRIALEGLLFGAWFGWRCAERHSLGGASTAW